MIMIYFFILYFATEKYSFLIQDTFIFLGTGKVWEVHKFYVLYILMYV